jgi:hypothetical protein
VRKPWRGIAPTSVRCDRSVHERRRRADEGQVAFGCKDFTHASAKDCGNRVSW